jgi:hypothetical protein
LSGKDSIPPKGGREARIGKERLGGVFECAYVTLGFAVLRMGIRDSLLKCDAALNKVIE